MPHDFLAMTLVLLFLFMISRAKRVCAPGLAIEASALLPSGSSAGMRSPIVCSGWALRWLQRKA